MNYSQIAILFLQGTLVAFTVLLLFRLRRRLGIGVLFACLGLFQFVQVILASTVYVSITNNFFVSPGSSVFFTVSLFALLIIYIKEDASETKKIIYALFIVNVIMAILLQTMGWNIKEVSTHNPFNLSTGLFDISGKVLIVGTIALFLDSLLIIVLFEFISKRVPFLFLQICFTMLIVVCFDTVVFSIFALSDLENLTSIITSGLISKGVFVIFYSILFYVYLKYFDIKERELTFLKTKDVFTFLTFKQKFETAEGEIKKAEEMYRLLTDHSTDLICLHKPDSTFKYISPSIKNLLGYDPSEFLGKQVFEILHNDDIQSLQDAIEQRVFSSGGIVDVISCRVRHKDGHFIWLEFVISLVFKEQEISYFVSTGRDVTERVVANEKIKNSLELLEKSEYSLNKASRMAKIGYWEYDSVIDLLTWSDYVYRIYGLDPKEETLSREEMLVFFDEKSQEKLLKATSDLDSTGIPYDIELKLINQRKEEIWLRTIVQPVYNDHNEVIGRRGVLHNITESKKIQLELSTSLELLEKAEFSKNKASKMAKIGYWEYDIATDIILWSESIYLVFGLDPKEEIPLRNEILAFYDEESQKQIEQANLDLDSKGIPYDIELKLINLRKEEVWVRNVVQPIYNEKNEIIGRRGVFQDITLGKLRQEELDQKTEKLYELNNALNAAQELAKVGSWFHDFSSNKSEWSEETFRIWGFDSKKPTPEEDEILGRIHKDDLELFNTATQLVYSEGESYDIEYRICLDDNEVKTVRSICKPIFDDDGNIVSLNGINQDITEQKGKQDELDNKTEKLYELNDALNQAQKLSHIGSWEWDMATDAAEWSDEMYSIYGVTKESFYPSNENVMKMVLPEDLHKIEKGLGSLLIDKMFVPFEFRIKRPSGEIRTVYIMALEKNSQEIIFGVTKDITERKIIEEENLRIKNNYRSLFDNASVSIWDEDFTEVFKEIEELRKLDIPNIKIYLEQNPTVLLSLLSKVIVNSVNKATLKLFKAKSSQDFFSNIENTFGEDADKVFIMLIEAIWTNKKSFTSEVNYKKLNGDEFVALFSIPIPQTEEEQKTVPISIQNIQNIKDAESAERESIKDLNSAQELAQVGSWFFNVLTKESEWSEETYRIWGFDLNETTPNEDLILNRIHIDDREMFLNAAELVYSQRAPYDIEFRICLPNDDEKWIRSICKPILDDTGKVVLLKGTNQDITEKKRASDKIEKAEELYRLLTDHSNDIICLQEPDSTFKYMSPSIKKVLGYEPSEFIGKQIFSIIHNDDIPSLKDAIEQKVFSKEIADNVYSFRARHKDGHFVWLEYLTSPVYIENEISYFVTSARDITQRVEANEIIKTSLDLLGKSEQSKNEASKIAKIGYWEFDIATDTFIWSDYLYQIYGLDTKDEIPSRTKIITLYDKESQEKIAQAIKDVGVKNSSYDLELKFTNLKDEEVWERSVVQAVYNDKNEVVGRRGVMQDITDSKNAQFELERSKKEIESSLELLEKKEYSLKQTSSIAKIGYWEYDIITDLFTWSEYVYDIYGIDLKDEIPSRKEMVAFYDKESQEKLAQATLDINLDGVPYDIELKLINLRKEKVWVRNVVQPVYNDQNEVVGRRGVIQDITASKNAQFQLEQSKQDIQISLELLEKSEHSKSEASKIAEIGYWEHDFITDCVIWSDYIHQIFGSNPKEGVPGREEVLDRFDKESQEKITQATLDLASKGISYDLELYFVNRRNEDVWIRNVAQPIYNEQKEIIGKRGVMQDITSSKNAQIELEVSKQEVENSLYKLERSEFTKNEASKVAKIGYHEYDIATDTFVWSDYVYHIFGFDPKEGTLSREVIIKLLDEESQEKMVQATLDINLTGNPYDIELKLVNLRNEEIWIRLVVQPIYNDQNKMVKRRGILQNITSSKKAQIELELSKQEVETSLNLLEKSEYAKNEASKVAEIGYHEYDIATDVFIWSEYSYDIFGFDKTKRVPPREEVFSLFDKESQEKLKQATLDLDLKGIPYDLELKINNLKNEEVWVRNIAKPVYNEQNELVGRRGITQNITSSKKAQIQLEVSKQEIEASLNLLAKSEYSKNEASKIAKIGFLEDDIATDTFIWSEHLYHIFGFDPREKVPSRKEIAAFFDEESQKKMADATLELDSKGVPFDLELKLINLRNEEVWARIVVQPVYNDQNEIVGRRGVFQDITASKKAKIQLEISKIEIENSLYELERSEFTKNEASKIAKIGYWENDIATNDYIWSDYIYHIFGVDPKEEVPPGEEIVPLFDKESQERMAESLLELDTNGTPVDIELKLINFKNEVFWVRNVAQPVYNDQNEIVGRRGITQDITATKKAQIELENSLYKLERSEFAKNEASKIAKIGYWEQDIATNDSIWSDYIYHIFGVDPKGEFPPREEFLPLFDKDSQEILGKALLDLDSNGTPFDIELNLINFKNEVFWIRSVAQAVYNDQNEIVGRRGITQDITASKKAQLELELSKQEIETSLYELEKSEYTKNEASKIAEIGYHEYDIATDVFIWSEHLYDIFGFDKTKRIPPREEIVPLFDKESQIMMKQATLDLDFKGIPYDLELKITNLKNEEVWVRNIAEAVYNDQNKIVGRRGITQNITSSKKAQFELELSKEDILTSLELLENSEYSKNEASKVAKIGYHEYEIATDTFIWSDYVYRIFGFNKERGVPSRKEVFKLLDKESQMKMKEATLQLDLKGASYDLELKLINRRKKTVWVRIIAQPVYNEQNEIVKRRGILQDITVSKKAQFEIELSKEEIQISLEMLGKSERSRNEASKMAKMGHLEYDIESDSFVWSDYLYEIFGFDPNNEIPPRSEVLAFFDKESQSKILQSVLELETNGTPYDIELKFINQRKEEIWARSVFQPIYNDKNEITGRRGTFQNITASKVAQLALESSRQEIKTSLELLERSEYSLKESSKVAKIAYHGIDIATHTLIWSDYVYEILGFDIKDGVPSREDVVSILVNGSVKKLNQANFNLMSTGNSYDIELKIFNSKKKEEVWVRNVVQPVYNDQDEIVGRRGVMQDITERKRIEDEHLRIKDNYRRLFENATISIWNEDLTEVFKGINELKKLDIPDIKIYFEQHPDVLFSLLEKVKVNTVNKATLELYKAKSYEQFLGSIQDTFGKGADKIFGNLLVSIWNNEKTFTSEVNFKTLEGEEFLALFSVAIPQTELEQKTVPVSIQSIQSIKDAELETSKSIKKLKEAEKLANVGSWVINVLTQESTYSEEMYHMWGLELKKYDSEMDVIVSRIHKEDLELFNSAFNKAITKGTPYDIEFRICLPNKEEKWIRSICQCIFGDNGEVVSLTGSSQDITDQKLATDEIEKAEEMYSLLTNNSNDIICLQELDSTFTYISPSIKNLLGYEQSDFLGKQIFDLVHKDDIQPLADAMEQRITNGVEDAATFRVRHKQGHFIWLESLSSPVYKDNKISYFVTSSRDVTEWVLARQDIQKYQTSLQQMTTEMTLIEEKQKKEIASNIHDHLSQSLVISKMKINELKKKSELKIINEDLKFIESHISEALENSRKITYELSPPVLYQLGIIDALNWLLENVEATHNIKCVVNSNVNSIKLSEANSILLYRCIQEVIKNAVKYANASLLTLNLDKNKLGINIVLTDNGGGFDTSTLNDYQNHSGSGFGLFAVQERVKNIQGEFTITSKINTGTSVKIFIPLAI